MAVHALHQPDSAPPRAPAPLPGAIYKLAAGLAQDQIVRPAIDLAQMRVDAVICTPAVDRQGDVIAPRGVDAEHYAQNPVVLWEHGFDPHFSAPIAKCQRPDGSLALSITEGAVEGSAYFTDKTLESSQIFALIAEGIVRATSIHVLPKAPPRTALIGGQQADIYEQTELLEWSFGRVGVNPEAVAKLLHRGRLDGRQIMEPLKKSLLPFVPLRKVQGKGWSAAPPSASKPKPARDGAAELTTWLRGGRFRAVSLTNWRRQLRAVAQGTNLTIEQRQVIRLIARQFQRAIREPPEPPHEPRGQALASVREQFTAIQQTLSRRHPAR